MKLSQAGYRPGSGALSKEESGFTLVELLVVVALIGLISVFALPTVTSYTKVSLNAAIREIAGTVKETYNSTMMTGQVHRLVYDLKNQRYWVESGPSTVLLDTAESREREARRKRFSSLKEEKPVETFSMDKTITRSKVSLPRGVEFEDIITEQSKDPITEDKTYTHFFPQGLTEQTIIHLKDGADHHVSLMVSPLVGHTRVVDRYVSGKEAFGEE